MKHYLANGSTPVREYPEGVRIVHNFYPGPHGDPGQARRVGHDGFRVWITDLPIKETKERPCHCDWLGGREHYGTVAYVDADGVCHSNTFLLPSSTSR